MGNFVAFNVLGASSIVSGHVQSSLAEDMESRAQALLSAETAAGRGVVDAQLSGAGDGHSFMFQLLTSPDASPAVDPRVTCYMAGSETELQNASQAALAELGAGGRIVVGWAEVGSSAGRRWMGMIFSSPPLG